MPTTTYQTTTRNGKVLVIKIERSAEMLNGSPLWVDSTLIFEGSAKKAAKLMEGKPVEANASI